MGDEYAVFIGNKQRFFLVFGIFQKHGAKLTAVFFCYNHGAVLYHDFWFQL